MSGIKKLSGKSLKKAILLFFLLCIFSIGINQITKVVSIISILPIAVLFLVIGNLGRNVCEVIEKKVLICVGTFILLIVVVAGNYSISRCMVDLSSMTLGGGLYIF